MDQDCQDSRRFYHEAVYHLLRDPLFQISPCTITGAMSRAESPPINIWHVCLENPSLKSCWLRQYAWYFANCRGKVMKYSCSKIMGHSSQLNSKRPKKT